MTDFSPIDSTDGELGLVVSVLLVAFELAVSVVLRLVFDAERRIEGVRRDSRAFGSCNCICLPMEGIFVT